MSKGENIYKRKDGRWEARYIKGYHQSGKIHYGFCYGKTYKEAKEKASKAKAALLSSAVQLQLPLKRRFSWFCEEWYEISRNRFKESTAVKYRAMLSKYISPRLGGCYPADFSDEVLEKFTEELLHEDRLSEKTVKDLLLVVHSVMKFARNHYPGVFPAIEIYYPRLPRKEMRVLSREEQTRFSLLLMSNLDECSLGILLALQTGMRIGEICALRWSNISLEEGTLRVDSTMQRLKDLDPNAQTKTRIVIGSPKSMKSARIIPLNSSMVKLCCRMVSPDPQAFVLTGTRRCMEPRCLQYRLKRLTKDAGLEGVHFHTLRHSFATRCVEVGFEIKSLSEILGHASTTTTLDRYVHASMELKRSNMDKMKAVWK